MRQVHCLYVTLLTRALSTYALQRHGFVQHQYDTSRMNCDPALHTQPPWPSMVLPKTAVEQRDTYAFVDDDDEDEAMKVPGDEDDERIACIAFDSMTFGTDSAMKDAVMALMCRHWPTSCSFRPWETVPKDEASFLMWKNMMITVKPA